MTVGSLAAAAPGRPRCSRSRNRPCHKAITSRSGRSRPSYPDTLAAAARGRPRCSIAPFEVRSNCRVLCSGRFRPPTLQFRRVDPDHERVRVLLAAASGRPRCSYCWAPATAVMVTSRSGRFRPPTLQRAVRGPRVAELRPRSGRSRPPTLQLFAVLIGGELEGTRSGRFSRPRCSTPLRNEIRRTKIPQRPFPAPTLQLHTPHLVRADVYGLAAATLAAHVAATARARTCPRTGARSGRSRPPTLQRHLQGLTSGSVHHLAAAASGRLRLQLAAA